MSDLLHPYSQSAVKRSAVAFLAGRGVSALLTLIAFTLAARLLGLQDYGYYAAALALMELGLALSSAGLDWVSLRTLPGYRVNAGGPATVAMVVKLASLQAAIFVALGGLIALSAEFLAKLLAIQGAETAFLCAGALVAIEGIGRLSRDQMLGILMHQEAGQVCQVVRASTLASLLGWVQYTGTVPSALVVLQFELAAASGAALLGGVLLARALWQLWPSPVSNPDWQAPSRRELRALATHTYASYLLSLAYGPQLLTMLIARLLGAEAVGVFGFARSFADQVRRYLPTDLLQSVIRPALVAYYSKEGSYGGLMLRLGIWFKSSLVVLLPLLAFFAAFGELGARALGGAKFAYTWPVILVLLCGAGMMAWRRVLEFACNTVLAPSICVRAGLLLLLVPPLTFAVLQLTGSLLAAAVLFVVAEAVFCLRAMQLLQKTGFLYVWRIGEFMRIGLALLVTAILLSVLSNWIDTLILAALLTVALSLSATYFSHPLTSTELPLISQWSPRLTKFSFTRRGPRK